MKLGLPLRGGPAEMVIAQPFGAASERHAAFGLSGHNGVDFEAAAGDPVLAVDDGTVMEVRHDAAGYGVTVRLAHNWGESRYARGLPLSVSLDLVLGAPVLRGERLFNADGTGHVHFGLRLRGADGSLDYSNANGFGGYEDPLPHLPAGLKLPAPAKPRK